MPFSKNIPIKNAPDWKHGSLAHRFNTHRALDEIHPDAAVNIYVGWPVFFEQIKYQAEFLGKQSLSILDFGCGAGEFCAKLHMRGHTLVGIDKSDEMLALAKDNSAKEVTYLLSELVDKSGECNIYKNCMDVVTAIHSFDWNENVGAIIKQLSDFLVPNGLMIFAVFPKGHVVESLRIKNLFEDFDSDENPTRGICNFDGIRIPVFIKEPAYYDTLFEKMGYSKVLEYYPQYPKAFLTKYKWDGAMYPEMVILAYRKSAK